MYFPQLLQLIHGCLINFFLGVETGAHRPFMEQVQKRTGFHDTDGFRIGQEV